ncbi:hypothetical protein LINPERHAP1_LOCUS6946 [Linum perenne]
MTWRPPTSATILPRRHSCPEAHPSRTTATRPAQLPQHQQLVNYHTTLHLSTVRSDQNDVFRPAAAASAGYSRSFSS